MKIPSFTRKELSSLFFSLSSLTEKNIIYDGINFLNSFLFSFPFYFLSSFLFFFSLFRQFCNDERYKRAPSFSLKGNRMVIGERLDSN